MGIPFGSSSSIGVRIQCRHRPRNNNLKSILHLVFLAAPHRPCRSGLNKKPRVSLPSHHHRHMNLKPLLRLPPDRHTRSDEEDGPLVQVPLLPLRLRLRLHPPSPPRDDEHAGAFARREHLVLSGRELASQKIKLADRRPVYTVVSPFRPFSLCRLGSIMSRGECARKVRASVNRLMLLLLFVPVEGVGGVQNPAFRTLLLRASCTRRCRPRDRRGCRPPGCRWRRRRGGT